ncbi:hypothetical protein XENORESO_019072, partial [Xenotaenia resolanae]
MLTVCGDARSAREMADVSGDRGEAAQGTAWSFRGLDEEEPLEGGQDTHKQGMAEPELLLDSNIRLWVVLPIVFITFLVGVIRHYVSILLQSDKKLTLEQVSDSQVLIRSRILRENGKYIPKQ